MPLHLVLQEYTYSPYHPESKYPKISVYCDGIDKNTFKYTLHDWAYGIPRTQPSAAQTCTIDDLPKIVHFSGTAYAGQYYQFGNVNGFELFKGKINEWNGTDDIEPYEIGIAICGN